MFLQASYRAKIQILYSALVYAAMLCCQFMFGGLFGGFYHRMEINRRATRDGTFVVCVPTHVALRIFIIHILASQMHFPANRNAELAVPPLF